MDRRRSSSTAGVDGLPRVRGSGAGEGFEWHAAASVSETSEAESEELIITPLFRMNTAEVEKALGCTKREHASRILNELEKLRALSLGEEKSLSEGAEQQRRTSMLAMSTEESIRDAEPEERNSLLLDSIKGESAKKDAGEAEFASWGLSCISELSQGQAENRQYFVTEGTCQIVLDLMGYFPNDIFVQWQGCHCIGVLASSTEAADKFGSDAMEAVVNCMSRTDVSDLVGIYSLLIYPIHHN